MSRKESLKSLLFHATDYLNKAKIPVKPKIINATGTPTTPNEASDARKCLRAIIAGVVTMGSTLAALGAAGLLKDLTQGLVAVTISFFFGFSVRLGTEYGITSTPPPKPTA